MLVRSAGFGPVDDTVSHWDILFRMLQPHEFAAAMGFIEAGSRSYHFTGNSVPVNTARDLVTALMAT